LFWRRSQAISIVIAAKFVDAGLQNAMEHGHDWMRATRFQDRRLFAP
jgi:hypothetical protein